MQVFLAATISSFICWVGCEALDVLVPPRQPIFNLVCAAGVFIGIVVTSK